MDLLEVKKISKTYGTGEATVHALKKATFSVPKGEFVAIVGESGSGKSTLLNMIGALDTPTSGKVFIDGKDIFSMKERSTKRIYMRKEMGARSFFAPGTHLLRKADIKYMLCFLLVKPMRTKQSFIFSSILFLHDINLGFVA